MFLLAFLPFLPLALADSSLRLHHRLYSPSAPDVPFTERASLLLQGSGPRTSASLVPSETLHHDFHAFSLSLTDGNQFQHALYQLALERPGDKDQSHWHVSSVKACHLTHANSDSITIHLATDGIPYAFDYFVDPLPHDGSCPKQSRSISQNSIPLDLSPITNTTLLLRYPTFPPSPQLRTPPPLTQQGTQVEPVPEKSFIQKYWVYILVAVAALVLSPSAPEEEGGPRQGGGQK